MKYVFLVLCALMTSCASSPRVAKDQKAFSTKKPFVVASSAKKISSPEARDFARDQALILAKKRQIASGVTAHPQNKRLLLEPSSTLSPVGNSTQLMTELRECYARNNELCFQSRYQALNQKFPASPSLAEAHYLAGLLALSNKNYGKALKSFDLILKDPRNPRASQALFAQGITYKRMNLQGPAGDLFRRVRLRYPKSVEAQRAGIELALEQKRTR